MPSCGVSRAFERKRGALQPACVRGLSGAGKGSKGGGDMVIRMSFIIDDGTFFFVLCVIQAPFTGDEEGIVAVVDRAGHGATGSEIHPRGGHRDRA